jgi:hypothetical protein
MYVLAKPEQVLKGRKLASNMEWLSCVDGARRMLCSDARDEEGGAYDAPH